MFWPNKKTLVVNIDPLTFLKAIVLVLGVVFLYYIRYVVAIFFVSALLAAAFSPWVNWLEKKRIPRAASVLMIYSVLLTIIIAILSLIIPVIVEQIQQLAETFPVYWNQLSSGFVLVQEYSMRYGLGDQIQGMLNNVLAHFNAGGTNLWNFVGGFVGAIFSGLVVLVFTFYMIVEAESIRKITVVLLSTKQAGWVVALGQKVQEKMGLWLRGQLILCLIIGVLSYIGLISFGVKYALLLAIIAGLAEAIPYLGPILASVPAFIVALGQSPVLGLGVIVLYAIIQVVENNILVPQIMRRTVGLNPIVSLVAVLIGAQFGGFVGVLLAIPTATVLSVVTRDILKLDKNNP